MYKLKNGMACFKTCQGAYLAQDGKFYDAADVVLGNVDKDALNPIDLLKKAIAHYLDDIIPLILNSEYKRAKDQCSSSKCPLCVSYDGCSACPLYNNGHDCFANDSIFQRMIHCLKSDDPQGLLLALDLVHLMARIMEGVR